MSGTVHAAGGVLWRPGRDGAVQVALVHRPRYDDWSLPKGKLTAGEHPLVGACREVQEETGARPVGGPYLGSVTYRVAAKAGTAPKVVDYWAMRAATESPLDPNDEVDALTWLATADAQHRLSYPHDQRILARFTDLPPLTAAVLLLRHGRAGARSEWPGDDALRPLDAKGVAQAVAAARVLPWYGPDRVLSADRVRCVETVEPLASALGIGITQDPDFSEEQHKKAPDRTAQRVRDVAAAGGVTVVSSQGGVIPDIVSQLATADRVEVGPIESSKGSLWALFFRGSTLVVADYYSDLEHAPR